MKGTFWTKKEPHVHMYKQKDFLVLGLEFIDPKTKNNIPNH